MERHYENKFAYFRISNQIVFLDVKDNVVLNLDAATAITTDRLQLQEDKSYPVLFNINGLTDSDKTGRDYMAKYGWLLTIRVGILANPFKAFTIARFYIQINKPKVDTMIFTDENNAFNFLSSQITNK